MYKIFILILAFLAFACHQGTEQSKISDTNDSTAIHIAEDNINSSTNTSTNSSTDTSIHFLYRNDTAFLLKGKEVICATKLKSRVRIGDTLRGNEYIVDEAFFVANCMVVLREVHVMGDFCHTPSVKSVELYTAFGDTIKPKTGYFQGNAYTAPSGSWGIITEEAEGDMYGYTYLNHKGELFHQSLNIDFCGYSGDILNTSFIGDSCLYFKNFSYDFRQNHSHLSIFKDGRFQLSTPAVASDTIQFMFFNEYEPTPSISQPYQYVELIKKDSSYFKSCIDLRRYYSKSKMAYQNFDFFIKPSHFMFTGIHTTSAPLNIQYAQRELHPNDSLWLHNSSLLTVSIEHSKPQDIQFIKYLELIYHHQGQSHSIANQSLLEFDYPGEKATKVFSKAIGDINGDTFLDFLLIIDTELCHKNIAVLSNTDNGLKYSTVFVSEFCWD